NKKIKPNSSLNAILNANDRDELVDWLRHRPLFYSNKRYGLVHAGLPPQWDITKVKEMAISVETALQGQHFLDLLKGMYGNYPDCWSEDLKGLAKLKFVLNCFTRMRYCYEDGRLDFKYKDKLGTQPDFLKPWFQLKSRRSTDLKIIFGHWSTLGFYEDNDCCGIDTGCLWGGQLTALKLGKTTKRISINCGLELK
ncbi:MAG: symmetrical bis(5'-nucleosyl)-tetraphosphatase, partial [Methylococcales bacterium]|nr:symmetrical bis(5'-nucleosyl)-tetraphosphatase [Methylococcales bacterium]